MIRYAIEMESGGYMKGDFYKTVEQIKVETVDLPIDADLMKRKSDAEWCLKGILSGTTQLPVIYDKNDPPKRVVKLDINFEEVESSCSIKETIKFHMEEQGLTFDDLKRMVEEEKG